MQEDTDVLLIMALDGLPLKMSLSTYSVSIFIVFNFCAKWQFKKIKINSNICCQRVSCAKM